MQQRRLVSTWAGLTILLAACGAGEGWPEHPLLPPPPPKPAATAEPAAQAPSEPAEAPKPSKPPEPEPPQPQAWRPVNLGSTFAELPEPVDDKAPVPDGLRPGAKVVAAHLDGIDYVAGEGFFDSDWEVRDAQAYILASANDSEITQVFAGETTVKGEVHEKMQIKHRNHSTTTAAFRSREPSGRRPGWISWRLTVDRRGPRSQRMANDSTLSSRELFLGSFVAPCADYTRRPQVKCPPGHWADGL